METLSHTLTTHGEGETMAFAARLAGAARGGEVVALSGRMGAGKTAFARGFVGALGDAASSPTFTVVHEYDTTPRVVHFDLYNIADADELYAIGYEEYFDDGTVVLMEWPREDALPAEHLLLRIEVVGEDERRITCTAVGDVHIRLLKEAIE